MTSPTARHSDLSIRSKQQFSPTSPKSPINLKKEKSKVQKADAAVINELREQYLSPEIKHNTFKQQNSHNIKKKRIVKCSKERQKIENTSFPFSPFQGSTIEKTTTDRITGIKRNREDSPIKSRKIAHTSEITRPSQVFQKRRDKNLDGTVNFESLSPLKRKKIIVEPKNTSPKEQKKNSTTPEKIKEIVAAKISPKQRNQNQSILKPKFDHVIQDLKLVQASKTESAPQESSLLAQDIRKNLLNLTTAPSVLYKQLDELKTEGKLKEFIEELGMDKELTQLWSMEAKGLIGSSENDKRIERLKEIFGALSEAQIRTSMQNNNFLIIIGNTVNHSATAAAQGFSADQLKVIAEESNSAEQVASLRNLISRLDKNADKHEEKLVAISTSLKPLGVVDCIDKIKLKLELEKLQGEFQRQSAHTPKKQVLNEALKRIVTPLATPQKNPVKIVTTPNITGTKRKTIEISTSDKRKVAHTAEITRASQQSPKAKKDASADYESLPLITEMKMPLSIEDVKKSLLSLITESPVLYKQLDTLKAEGNLKEFISKLGTVGLGKLWAQEVKMLVGSTENDKRIERLKEIFGALSEAQIRVSMLNNNFITIIGNKVNHSATAAAKAFSVFQLGVIASESNSAEQVAGLGNLISCLDKDDDEHEAKLDAVLLLQPLGPVYCTPTALRKQALEKLRIEFEKQSAHTPKKQALNNALMKIVIPQATPQKK